MSDSTYFIGVDAGGTKTHTIIVDENKNLISEYHTGPGNYLSVGLEKASENIFESIMIARLEAETKLKIKEMEIANSCIGLASLDTPKDLEILSEALTKVFVRLKLPDPILINDTQTALISGTSNRNALVIICGTGSNCYARNADNEQVWIDGNDYLLGDMASGYEMGRQALRYALQSFDKRIKFTILEKMICEQLKIDSIVEAKNTVYSPQFTKKEMGQLSYLVFNAWDQNDWAAREIVTNVEQNAYNIISTAISRLKLNNFDIVLNGGLFNHKAFYEPLVQKINQTFNPEKIIKLEKSPAWGAAQIAIERNH